MWRSECYIYLLGYDAAGIAYKDNKRHSVSSISKGDVMRTLAIMMVCRECRGPILFSTNPKKRPDKVWQEGYAPMRLCEELEGAKARCERCGAVSIAEMQWQKSPFNLTTRTATQHDGRRIWTTEEK